MLVFKESGRCSMHRNKKGELLCLSDSCSSRRLFCRTCANEYHQGHSVESMSRLCEQLSESRERASAAASKSAIANQLGILERRAQESFLRMQISLSSAQKSFSDTISQLKQQLLENDCPSQMKLDGILLQLRKGEAVHVPNFLGLLKQLSIAPSQVNENNSLNLKNPSEKFRIFTSLCDALAKSQSEFASLLAQHQIHANSLLKVTQESVVVGEQIENNQCKTGDLSAQVSNAVPKESNETTTPTTAIPQVASSKQEQLMGGQLSQEQQVPPLPADSASSSSQPRRSLRSLRSNKSNKSQRSEQQVLDMESNAIGDISFDFLDSPALSQAPKEELTRHIEDAEGGQQVAEVIEEFDDKAENDGEQQQNALNNEIFNDAEYVEVGGAACTIITNNM